MLSMFSKWIAEIYQELKLSKRSKSPLPRLQKRKSLIPGDNEVSHKTYLPAHLMFILLLNVG